VPGSVPVCSSSASGPLVEAENWLTLALPALEAQKYPSAWATQHVAAKPVPTALIGDTVPLGFRLKVARAFVPASATTRCPVPSKEMA
jgi:hypothetical protein